MFKKFIAVASVAATLGFGGVLAAGSANAATSLQPMFSNTVVNQFSGKCLDNSNFRWAEGNPVQQWTCGAAGGVDQFLKLVQSNGNEYLVFVAPNGSNWYVTPTGFRGQLVIESTVDAANDQAVAIHDGFYTFENTAGSLVMDDKSFSKVNGTPVIGYPFNGGTNQQWSTLRNRFRQPHVVATESQELFQGNTLISPLATSTDSVNNYDSTSGITNPANLNMQYDFKVTNPGRVNATDLVVNGSAAVSVTYTDNQLPVHVQHTLTFNIPVNIAAYDTSVPAGTHEVVTGTISSSVFLNALNNAIVSAGLSSHGVHSLDRLSFIETPAITVQVGLQSATLNVDPSTLTANYSS